MLTYKATTNAVNTTTVYLGSKVVGFIRPDGEQFRYYPKGSKVPGAPFSTTHDVKASLASE